jgi:hypothetical protein
MPNKISPRQTHAYTGSQRPRNIINSILVLKCCQPAIYGVWVAKQPRARRTYQHASSSGTYAEDDARADWLEIFSHRDIVIIRNHYIVEHNGCSASIYYWTSASIEGSNFLISLSPNIQAKATPPSLLAPHYIIPSARENWAARAIASAYTTEYCRYWFTW